MEKINRRNFVKSAGLSLAALGTFGVQSYSMHAEEKKNEPLTFGCAGFTFHKYNLDQALAMMKRVNIPYMSLKDFHLPINASDEKIAEVLGKFKAADIVPYAVGPIYMKSEQEVTDAFAYAKKVGVKLIVAVPNYELLPSVEKYVKEYDFRVAIHIHGPDIKIFPDAADVWSHIENLDERIGICYDITHTVRMGHNLVEDYIKYHSRIYDMHVKDVDKPNKNGHTVEGGRGIIDFRKFFATIIKYKYAGMCSIEHEKDMSDVLPGVAESIGFYHGILR